MGGDRPTSPVPGSGEGGVGVQLGARAGYENPVTVGGGARHLRHVHPLVGDALHVDPSVFDLQVPLD